MRGILSGARYDPGMLVRLYSRPGCHLCDVAREVILDEAARGGSPFHFEDVSIEGDDTLELEYGIRIPVVTIDGEERFEIEVDPGRFADAVREGTADPPRTL
jgi:hypothetical protein